MAEGSEFYLVIDGIFDIVGKGIIVTGQVQGGSISVGDNVVVASRFFENKNCNVLGIEGFRKKLKCAHPGDNVGITLSNIHKKEIHTKDTLKRI